MHQVGAMDLMHSARRGCALTCAFAASLLYLGCTSSSTNITAPTTDKCQISATNTPASFSAAGGAGAVTIATARDCTWSVAAETPWVTINGDRTGQGDATVSYSVATNPLPAGRSGTIAVGSEHVQLSQAAAPCRYSLDRARDAVPADGGELSVNVTTLTGCAWTAASSANWITVVSGQTASSSGTVHLSVAPNSAAARSGQVTIGDQAYVVDQPARATTPTPTPGPTPAPPPTPSPTPPPAPSPGGESIDLEGRILILGGSCPTIAFIVGGRVVVTNAGTDFKHGRCEDLSNGDTVAATGTIRADRAVDASRIEIKKR
jgi:hypothetical protein